MGDIIHRFQDQRPNVCLLFIHEVFDRSMSFICYFRSKTFTPQPQSVYLAISSHLFFFLIEKKWIEFCTKI